MMFRYMLEPLLSLRQFQLDLLQLEMASATKVLTDRERATAHARQRVAEMLQAWSAQRAQGATLDVQKEEALRRYLPSLNDSLAASEQALHEARRLHDTVSANLRQALQAKRGLEKHKASQQERHQCDLSMAQARAADEAWLASFTLKGASSP
jgi:flagellar biosynthesis chaperone FliJ